VLAAGALLAWRQPAWPLADAATGHAAPSAR
jgi:hypothetical protein